MEKVEYIQMKIYKQFKCDGSKCNSLCCKGWAISIDNETFEKYRQLDLEKFFKYSEEAKRNIFIMKPDGSCPMLDDDGLCKIQKQHGEDFLSDTCQYYPRLVKKFGNLFCERMLTLSCPVAADLILRQKKPIEFEHVQDILMPANSQIVGPDLTELRLDNVIQIQMTSVKILQNRRMTIDQRFLTLGFFFSEVGDIQYGGNDPVKLHNDIEMLQKLCTSKKFAKEHLPKFCRAVEFDSLEFIRVMINLMEALFGSDSEFAVTKLSVDKYFKSHNKIFEIEPDSSGNASASIAKLAKKYLSLDTIRDRVLKSVSHVIENYLVNEFIIQLYPYRIDGLSLFGHYYLFVISYKMQEFLLILHLENLCREQGKISDSQIENETIDVFKAFDHMLLHVTAFVEKMSETAKTKNEDIFEMMKSMLRV